MGSAPRHRQGTASGFLATSRVIGQSVSVALAGAIFATLGGSVAGEILGQVPQHFVAERLAALQTVFNNAFHTTFIVIAIITAIGVFTSLVKKEKGDGSDADGCS